MEKINKIELAWQQLMDWREEDPYNREFFIETASRKDHTVIELQLMDLKISEEVICLAAGSFDQVVDEVLDKYNRLEK